MKIVTVLFACYQTDQEPTDPPCRPRPGKTSSCFLNTLDITKTNSGTWQQAKDKCDMLGGYLPRFEATGDQDTLNIVSGNEQAWIGITFDSGA